MALFRRLNEVGVTVVVATHDLNLVKESGLRAIVIENGRIAGEPDTVLPTIEARR